MSQIFNDIQEIKRHINISSNLDIRMLEPYQNEALRYVSKFIPISLFEEIELSHSEVYNLIKRAVANFMLPFAAPFLKIHISNTGANNFNDAKMQKSDWWDIRDFCLSAIKIGDNALSDAIEKLQDTNLYNKLTLFSKDSVVVKLFDSPKAFEKWYNISNSWQVLIKLESVIMRVLELQIYPRLKACSIDTLLLDDYVRRLLEETVALYTVADIMGGTELITTTRGLVMQWEELPWQKSVVLTTDRLEILSDNYRAKAGSLLDVLLKYLKDNNSQFPCYQGDSASGREIIKKKSGLYL